jgi:hypothetical protein
VASLLVEHVILKSDCTTCADKSRHISRAEQHTV